MLLDAISPAPPDAILGLTEDFKQDARPHKINLGVGVYQDDQGATPVLPSVKAAEQKILAAEQSKSYMPIAGAPEYRAHVQSLLFGAGHGLLKSGRLCTAHTPGGTGGLRVGADLLKSWAPDATVWVSQPTWANHPQVLAAAGLPVKSYPYYRPESHGLDFDALCEALAAVPAGDIVLLHVCCHNPTGVDPSPAQWRTIGELAAKHGWTPFLDFAYQGFGQDLEADRTGLLQMAESVPELLVASSFSKNFGLYRERTGALTLLAGGESAAAAAFSHMQRTIRVLYSNPPAHGGLIVSTVLDDAALRGQWEAEVAAMRERIHGTRRALVQALEAGGADRDFSFIEQQQGMFSFSGLSDEHVAYLREEKAVYIVKGGRINVAGITSRNLPYLVDAMLEALRATP
jgi:aspartate/tyrosine/aromatic aminotransferase